MKYCKNCQVTIQTPSCHCPLCQSELTAQEGKSSSVEIFPQIPVAYQKYKLFLRLLIFLSIAAVGITILVNSFFQRSGWWSLIVVGSLVFVWFLVFNILTTRNSLSIISRNVLVAAALLALIDILYGFHHWSFNYAIPMLFFSSILAIVTIGIVQGLHFADFTIYFLSTSLLALLPLISIIAGLVTVDWPSIVCIASGILSLIALFVFADPAVKDELKRRFHL